jgi:NAD-dependent dihydropyrimidine dehydrogenase PreA subunit
MEKREYPVYLIKVESSRCNGCGECAEMCPADVFEMKVGTSFPARKQNCLGCGLCAADCPKKAVAIIHYSDEQMLAQVEAAEEKIIGFVCHWCTLTASPSVNLSAM